MLKTSASTALPAGWILRDKRKATGLTSQALAERSCLSAAFISQVERNKATPSVVSLLKLANALGVNISALIEVPQSAEIIRRGNDLRQLEVGSPAEYFQLGSSLPNQRMDAIMSRIPPGYVSPIDQREGEEFVYILEGELAVTVGDVRTTLHQGDSMHYDSWVPHSTRNETDRDVVLIYVGTPRLFPEQV